MKNLCRNFAFFAVISSFTSICSAASKEAPELTSFSQVYSTELIEKGRIRFATDCGFCHGRDSYGGAQGPDLSLSALINEDVGGELIRDLVLSGRPDAGMPAFTSIAPPDLDAIVAFLHKQKDMSEALNGGRRSVETSDINKGNVELGQRYFEAACESCHSATGDLAGIASRLEGFPLLQRMLYPRNSREPNMRPIVKVKVSSGEWLTGSLIYQDEFTLAMKDEQGRYRSWPINTIVYNVDDPLDAHIEQLAQYTDADMHNVLAYLLTLK